jgi:hypothetical protein
MFTEYEVSPIMEKVIEFLQDKDKLTVGEFRKEIYKMRINDREVNLIEKYLRDNGFIERKGKTIYCNNIVTDEDINGFMAFTVFEHKNNIKKFEGLTENAIAEYLSDVPIEELKTYFGRKSIVNLIENTLKKIG